KFNQFFEKNFDMKLEDWNGEQVVLTEKQLVDDISDALDEAAGVYINGNTIEEFVQNLMDEMMGEFGDEIHEIYDDTAVIEAYKTGDTSELSEEDLFTLEFASDVIDEVITEGMSDYEKELAIYNWQYKFVNYDESEFSPIDDEDAYDLNYYPYGVFKTGTAICVGNATTFKLFMGMLDIPCMIIHSTEEGEHAWNLVCIEDEWYHVDITFDNSGTETPSYTYFNVPDSFKVDDGYPWDRSEFPAADSIKHTYILKNAKDVESIDEVPQLVKDALDGKDTFLVINSQTNLSQIDDLIDAISGRLEDYQWVYIANRIRWGSNHYYIIEIYDERDLEDSWNDEWGDEWEEEEDDSEDDSADMDSILDGIF
ncbi:MAG: hypothetical protein II273_03600, partial [Lachnospiraceae bacterium]|nr:hypothetical protein [Lachnospiraceae bacterium]